MPIDPQDGGLDDWFVPANDGHPDDWFVPAPSAATVNPGVSNAPAMRPDPFAAYWSLIPTSRVGAMAWEPPILPDSAGQFPLPAPAPLSAPRIDSTRSLLGALAKLPQASPVPIPFQRAGAAARNGSYSAPPSLLRMLANDDFGYRTDQTEPVLDQTQADRTTSFSESDTDLAQPISCQGPTCSQGGSFGTTGMYVVSGRTLCRDCAVKYLGVQDLPAAEQTKILRNFLR